jgi:tetratricopeptide (TPR) repeat protein
MALFAWRVRRRWPVLPWAALWYAGSLAPVAGIAAVLRPGFGRYLYVPGAAVCWAVASGAALLWPRVASHPARVALTTAAFGLLLVSGFFLVRHTSSYRDDRTLYERVATMRPDQGYGWGLLGQYLLLDGSAQEAVAPLREAIQRSPEEPRYRLSLINALVELNQRPEALSIAQQGLRDFHASPTMAKFHYAIAKILATQDPTAVTFHLVLCLELAPERSDCQRSLRYLLSEGPNAASFRLTLEQILAKEEHRSYRAQIECQAYDRCG